MPQELDLPPGLRLEKQVPEKVKAANPRRRAKKRLSQIEKDTAPANDGNGEKAEGSKPTDPSPSFSQPASATASDQAHPKRDSQQSKASNGRQKQSNPKDGGKQTAPPNGRQQDKPPPPEAKPKQPKKPLGQPKEPSPEAQPTDGDADDSSAVAATPPDPVAWVVSQGTGQHTPSRSDQKRRLVPYLDSRGRSRRESVEGNHGAEGQRDKKLKFAAHLSGPELQRALKRGRVLRCEFRVNANDRRQGFAGLEGLPADIQIQNLEHQNRAYPGDQVAVQILPQSEWLSQRVSILRSAKKAAQGSPDNPNYEALADMMEKLRTAPDNSSIDSALRSAKSLEAAKQILVDKLVDRPDLRATGKVVAILEPSFRRQRVVGVLVEEPGGCLLVPVDPRLSKGRVDTETVPEPIKALLKDQAENPGKWHLVSGVVQDWPQRSMYPNMTVVSSIGPAGDIEVETQAILEAEGVDTEEFDEDVLACLPPTPWSIDESEVAARRDLRSVRTFTIDPPTARDLDDALSVEKLGDGLWRIGVHIADVAHFIPPGSALDAKAAVRATTVYLVQRAVPMLPPLLCEQLCSLNPGVDRLAFSVIWVMDEEGKVHEQWTGRTIIRSCAKLAYRHAQNMIDGAFRGSDGEEPPVPLEAPHTWPEVVGDVDILHRISRKLHAARFRGGALRLDNVKLSFGLDSDGIPVSMDIYEQQEANELIAEFMLLANMSVAQLIGLAFPDRAMLRRHQPPEDRKLGELEAAAQKLGYDIDCSSAGSIQESLKELRRRGEDPVIIDILQLIATKPMKQAQYFSTGSYKDPEEWRHFALAVPMYTHFTSPIRRYPDVVVHRLLARLLATDPAAATRKFDPQPLAASNGGSSTERPGWQVAAAAALEEICEAGAELAEDEAELLGDISDDELEAEVVPQKKLPARVLAKKTGQESSQPSKPSNSQRVPVSTSLLESEELQKVADHCNIRKASAKLCSDASSRLHLCVMLRTQPMVHTAFTTIVNGSKFFDVYIPKLGMESRIWVADMLPRAQATWKQEERVILLHAEEGDASAAQENGTQPPCLAAVGNADKLLNPEGLQPLALPLQIKAFSKLPVVMGARSAGAAKPLVAFSMLYLTGVGQATVAEGVEVPVCAAAGSPGRVSLGEVEEVPEASRVLLAAAPAGLGSSVEDEEVEEIRAG